MTSAGISAKPEGRNVRQLGPDACQGADPTAPIVVELSQISKSFGKVTAVHPLDLSIRRGDFVAILGPSGCGKSTLLRIIAGFLSPSTGVIRIAGVDVTKTPPERRPTNMVFQGYGLFPHMTVTQNIAYGLKVRKIEAGEITKRVAEILDLVKLTEMGDRNISQLSGGQQQRVALARALVLRPEVLLLDEPLAALDLKLRQSMQDELRHIHRTTGGTFLFVTHDQQEAMGLANKIVVMDHGKVVQQGSAEEIYLSPTNRFVSTFIGEANILTGTRRAGVARFDVGISFPNFGPDEAVVGSVRPEAITVSLKSSPPTSADNMQVVGRVEDMIFLGPVVKYVVLTHDGTGIQVQSSNVALRRKLSVGAEVVLSWPAAALHVLAAR
jgi:spermidine/putrescine transport system ATP-binding protein